MALSKDHHEVKMLIHDWSHHILVYQNPGLAQKILTEQIKAIDRLASGKASTNQIMSDFLLNSGLYDEGLKSLGLEAKRLAPKVGDLKSLADGYSGISPKTLLRAINPSINFSTMSDDKKVCLLLVSVGIPSVGVPFITNVLLKVHNHRRQNEIRSRH